MSTEIAVFKEQIQALGIVNGYAITEAPEAIWANEQLGRIKSLAKEIEAAKQTELRPLREQDQEVRYRYREAERMLESAEITVKRALLDFRQTEARAVAARRIEAEKLVAAEAARQRSIAEAARAKAEARAAKLEERGKHDEAIGALALGEMRAAMAIASAELAPAAAATPKPVELEGLSTSSRWVGEVTNPLEFLRWLASDACPIDPVGLVSFSTLKLNDLARTFTTAREIPGFRAARVETIRRG